ncbi:hypothetical protein LOK49_LG10G02178 [Camellia lanceoleosa]|uniref:Uncharacterized protein n=1 Tax=Camellia lanceoleosa TaxID=1840588 RepID=A0ACC0GC87_9ERIC|nr:hypothetical protein LOK49_LG10G02178 [Camellia lanceoleosa]
MESSGSGGSAAWSFFPWAFPGEVAVGVAAAWSWEFGLESSQLGVEDWSFLGGGYESSRPVWAWGVGRCSRLGMAWALQQRRGALGAVAAGGVDLGRGLLISFGG